MLATDEVQLVVYLILSGFHMSVTVSVSPKYEIRFMRLDSCDGALTVVRPNDCVPCWPIQYAFNYLSFIEIFSID